MRELKCRLKYNLEQKRAANLQPNSFSNYRQFCEWILPPLFTIHITQLNAQVNVNAATEMLTERSTERTHFDR